MDLLVFMLPAILKPNVDVPACPGSQVTPRADGYVLQEEIALK